MKKLLTLLITVIFFGIGLAQEKEKLSPKEKAKREKNIQAGNPFKEFGYTPKIATLSKGKYLEFHDLDSIVPIGSVMYNVYSQKIISFKQVDSLGISEATLKPEVISRWLSPDPLSDEFPDKSPYNFVNNNPIRFIDPLGLAPEDIIIHFTDADGNKQTHTYQYGKEYKGDNAFVKDAYTALNYLVDNNADVTGVIKNLSSSENDVSIYENTPENNKLFKNPARATYFMDTGQNSKGAEIIWDSNKGAAFTNTKGIISWVMGEGYSEDGRISPAEALLHELGHAESNFKDPKQHKKDSQSGGYGTYKNKEEYDVIRNIENPASKRLNHVQRKGHYGYFFKATSPTSITPVKKKK